MAMPLRSVRSGMEFRVTVAPATLESPLCTSTRMVASCARSGNAARMAKTAPASPTSMTHCVDQVVDADANAERGEFFGVIGIVGVLPGIAEIQIVTDGDHEAAVIVID